MFLIQTFSHPFSLFFRKKSTKSKCEDVVIFVLFTKERKFFLETVSKKNGKKSKKIKLSKREKKSTFFSFFDAKREK